MDADEAEKASFDLERMARHAQAIAESDLEFLRSSLGQAADRMADIADALEKDRHYDPVGFLRASARRYWRVAGVEPMGARAEKAK